jgi:hypothetical protein
MGEFNARLYDMRAGVASRREGSLQGVADLEDNRRTWRYEESVAAGALIRFKLYYWLLGRRFKDDNSGRYYVADRPELQEHVPPPPEALVAAMRSQRPPAG